MKTASHRTGERLPLRPMLLFSVVLLAAAAFAAAALLTRSGYYDRLPSAVVLVTIDTLRADFVSFSGQVRFQTTPFLDKLAREGVVFTEAHASSSWTPPSMASLFTSRAPSSHGVVTGIVLAEHKVVEQPVLPATLTTLAETLRSAGYLTVGVAANRHLAAGLGFEQGFDFYYERANFLTAPELNRQVAIQLRNAFGEQWRETWKNRPTFLWIHYFDPHAPYFARKPWIDRYSPDFEKNSGEFPAGMNMQELKRRYPRPDVGVSERIQPLYGSEVSYLDDHFRRLSRRLGLDDDNVLMVITSDHGEEIADHGRLDHGQTLYQEVLRVPLLIHWPSALRGGRRIDTPVSLVDVYPTLVELLGLSWPADLEGQSLVPLFRGRSNRNESAVYFELHPPRGNLQGLRDGRWKLIRENRAGGRVELFDLSKDPRERHDLATEQAAITRRMEAALTRKLEGLRAPPDDAGSHVTTDPHLVEQLRALGYAD